MASPPRASAEPEAPAAATTEEFTDAPTIQEQGNAAQHIPVGDDENDSAYGDDDLLSDTTSIPSTIMRHRYEHGRRYHKFREGEYYSPNDDQQNDALDIAHHLSIILFKNKLHATPLTDPKRILDLGCGTGIWCIDMADQYPEAELIGMDLSPIQPSFVPPNCKFEIDDFTSPWTYQPNSFDMIHIRYNNGSVSDWPSVYNQCYTHLAPGGYLNQVEMTVEFKSDDGTLTPDNPMAQWTKSMWAASENFGGKSFKAIHNMKGWIEQAGFQDVEQTWYKVPTNGWSSDPHMKEVGRWCLLQSLQGAEGWGLFLFTRVLGWSVDEAKVFIAKFKNALKDRKVHAYFEVCTITGKKPETAT